MKKSTIKYNLLILFICIFSKSFGQDNLMIQLEYANTLYKTGQYFDAITEYKRLLFFDSTKSYLHQANFQIGKCYKAGAKFDDAIKYFSIAEINSTDLQERFNSQIQIVRCNILRRTITRTIQLIDDLEKVYKEKDKIDSLNYWRGWAYIFSDDWKKAAESFSKINYYHELKNLCNQVEKEKVSITFPTVISYILPGAGQIYTGNVVSGLLSFGWNFLFGYLTINAFQSDRVFDGIALLSLLWQRFYRGNIDNAKNFAIEKNLQISNKTLKYLQNEYKGSKP